MTMYDALFPPEHKIAVWKRRRKRSILQGSFPPNNIVIVPNTVLSSFGSRAEATLRLLALDPFPALLSLSRPFPSPVIYRENEEEGETFCLPKPTRGFPSIYHRRFLSSVCTYATHVCGFPPAALFAGLLKKGNTRKYRRNSNRSFGLANHNKVKIVSPRRMQCAVNFLISIYYCRDFGTSVPYTNWHANSITQRLRRAASRGGGRGKQRGPT